MKAVGRWLIIVGILVSLELFGRLAVRLLLILGELALRLFLGVCVVGTIWIVGRFIKAALKAQDQQLEKSKE